MALTWDASKVKNWSDQNAQISDQIIWCMMFTGTPAITEANAQELYARIHLMEHLQGTFLSNADTGEPIYIGLADIKARIGLSTNVSSMTRGQFVKQKLDHFFAETLRGAEAHK